MQNQNADADAVDAAATCNLDCFATGRCTCQPDTREETA